MTRNVLHVVRSLEIGGAERVVTLLANNVDPDRFTSFVACVASGGQLAASLRDRERLFVIGNQGRIGYESLRSVIRLVQRHNIDLVHSHDPTGLLHGTVAARLCRVPVVHTKHGFEEPHREKLPIRAAVRASARTASSYVCVSDELRYRMKDELKLSDRRARRIYNGIEAPSAAVERRHNPDGAVRIGYVGRLTSVKNHELLIRAFAQVAAQRPQCTLEFVGGGDSETSLRQLVEQLSLEDRVVFHGFQVDVSPFFDRLDVFALTSFYEGLSMSLLEAISRGKPSIVSAVGGNTEVITDEVNGFVFESDNQAELATKLLYTVDNIDSSHLGRVRKNAQESFERRFTIQAMVEQYEALYSSLL